MLNSNVFLTLTNTANSFLEVINKITSALGSLPQNQAVQRNHTCFYYIQEGCVSIPVMLPGSGILGILKKGAKIKNLATVRVGNQIWMYIGLDKQNQEQGSVQISEPISI